jgi:hypothetical protein
MCTENIYTIIKTVSYKLRICQILHNSLEKIKFYRAEINYPLDL